MYYLVYGFLYLISLLPYFILYRISDAAYLLLYYVAGYRKKVVMNNLAIAFPEKPIAERTVIAKKFYKNFVDTFIETVKLLSLSDKEFDKRCHGDFTMINEAAASGKSIHIIAGHQFNWEYANLVLSKHITIPFIGIVANVENKVFNRIYYKFRSRYGTILIPNNNFQRRMAELMRNQYSLCLAADQNTPPSKAYWLNFFGKPVPFVVGPHKSIVRHKPVIVYFNLKKIKRGYYQFEVEETLTDISNFSAEELALKYRDFLEHIIRSQPENYLWSHRRWKHQFSNDYSKQWIDKDEVPATNLAS